MRQRGVDFQRAVRGEVRVVLIDARVEHRPDDVLAAGGKRRARRIGLDRRQAAVDQRVDREVRPDPVDRPLAQPGAGRIGGLALLVVDPDKAADDRHFEAGEQILFRQFALGLVDALVDLFGLRPVFLDRARDFGLDALARGRRALAILQVDVDDHQLRLGLPAFLLLLFFLVENVQQRDRDDGLVEYLGREQFLLGFLPLVWHGLRSRVRREA